MKNHTIDNIVDNLFYVMPIVHKKLLKIEPPETPPNANLSRIQVAILGIIDNEGSLPISEIAKKLLIPKPQMTYLINNLVKSGLVEKRPDPKDKRVTNVALTPAGKATFRQFVEFLKGQLRKNLSYLTEKELEELSQLLTKLKELIIRH